MTREVKTVTEHPTWPEEGAAVIDLPFIAAIAEGLPNRYRFNQPGAPRPSCSLPSIQLKPV